MAGLTQMRKEAVMLTALLFDLDGTLAVCSGCNPSSR